MSTLHIRANDRGGGATPARPAERARYWVITGAAFTFLALTRAGVVEERDPYWQIRAGLENLDGLPLTRPDSWSWAPVDGLFTQTSPAWNDVLGLAWRIAGFWGVFLVAVVSIGAYLAVTTVLAKRLGASPLGTLVGVGIVAIAVLPMLSPRAALVAQTLFLLSLVGVDWVCRRSPGTPMSTAVLGIGGVAVAWIGMWIHLSWLLLAPALWLAVLAMLALAPGRNVIRVGVPAVAAGVGLGLGALAGPYGAHAWAFSREVQAACEGVVTEWLPVLTPGLWQRWLVPEVLAFGVVAATLAATLRRNRGLRPSRDIALVAGLLVLAAPAALGGWLAIRFIGVSLLTLGPLVACAATLAGRRLAAKASSEAFNGAFRSERLRHWASGRPWPIVWTAVLVLVSPLVLLAAANHARPSSLVRAVAALPEGCRLLSDPGSSAPVILLRPDVKVWIDGRADYWGRARNLEAVQVLSGDVAGSDVLAHATCVLLDPNATLDISTLRHQLDTSASWAKLPGAADLPVWVRAATETRAPTE